MVEYISDELTEILSHVPDEMKDPHVIGTVGAVGALFAVAAASGIASREEKKSKAENTAFAWIHWHMIHHTSKKTAPTNPTDDQGVSDEDDKLQEMFTLLGQTTDNVILRDLYQLRRMSPSVNVSRAKELLSHIYTDDNDVFVCCLCLSFWYALCRLESQRPAFLPRIIDNQYVSTSGSMHATLINTIQLLVSPLMDANGMKSATIKRRVSNMLFDAFKKHTETHWTGTTPVSNPLLKFFRDEIFSPAEESRCEVPPLPNPVPTTPTYIDYDQTQAIQSIIRGLPTLTP